MLEAQREGRPLNKAQVYRDLAAAFPKRTTKAFEYRMQNISYVFSLLGRPWLKGAAPAKNVGTNVAAVIEGLIAEIEGKASIPVVAVEVETRKRMESPMRIRPTGDATPSAIATTVSTYRRDPAVRAWVLQRARGICECCNAPAPFPDASGVPYLEIHHVRQLADGGSDRVSNAVALCPNCHRRMHFGADAVELASAMYERIPELIPEHSK